MRASWNAPVSGLLALCLVLWQAILLWPGSVLAEGAVEEISQTAAIAGGITAADAPGFPVTLDSPGSYLLTSDLIIADAGTTAIHVTASDVKIDLGGFKIVGPVRCSSEPVVSCAPKGAGDGIRAAAARERVSVRNGIVRGMGDDGINLNGNGSSIDRVKAFSNGGGGLRVAINGELLDSTGERNGDYGISAGGRSTVRRNTAFANGSVGIKASNSAVVSGNVSYKNGSHGFVGGVSGSFVENSSYDNGGDGFHVGNVTTLSHNSVSFNAGWGIRLTRSGRYGDNKFSSNTLGSASDGRNIGGNICNGNTACP